jgi:S1-C subfamily serine protease
MKSRPNKFNLSLYCVFSLILATATRTVLAEPSAKTIDQVKRGVVSIATFDGSGKPLLLAGGFFVRSNRIVTSLHVLKGASKATIRTFDGQNYPVEGIVALNENNDLALLQTGTPASIAPLSLAVNVESEGEKVTMVSALDDASWNVSSGVTDSLWYIQGAGEYLRITAKIRHGNSGSPIINERGEVVAIAALHIESADELSFAVPCEILQSLLSHDLDLKAAAVTLDRFQVLTVRR